MPTPVSKYQPKNFSLPTQSASNLLQNLHLLLFKNRLISFAVGLIVLVLAANYINDTYFSPTRSATVIGIGETTVKPAKATVSFSYIFQGLNRQDTITQGDAQFNSIITGLQQFNPSAVDRTAHQIIDSPTTNVVEGVIQRATTPQYVTAAQITIDQPEKIQDMIRYLYDSGATTLTQVRYVPENEDKTNQKLRELAVKDAKDKVKHMARAAGASVGKVIAIQEGASTLDTGTSVTSTGETDTLDPLGNLRLQSIVTVTFQLR